MRRRRASARRVKIHHKYTVEEAAEATGSHKNTIRRWIATKAFPALTEKRPHLIPGRYLHAFLTAPKAGRIHLKPGECYCVKCHLPKQPALGMAEYVPINARSGNLRGFCPDCETLMHRRVSLAKLSLISGDLDVTILDAQPRLKGRGCSTTNDDFRKA